ncbi:MAG: hypothetical protein AAFY73_02340 [Pseudomonadota bacterium]
MDVKYQNFIKNRTEAIENKKANLSAFDRTLITVSSSSIAASGYFALQIGALGKSLNSISLLGIGWVFFASCVLLNLISYLSAATEADRTVEVLDNRYEDEHSTPFQKSVNKTDALNYCALLSFVIGVLLRGTFVIQNLGNLNG